MKALVIAPQPFFSPRGTPFSVYYRTAVLAELGVEVDLLTYGEGQDVDLPNVRILRIPRFGFLGPVAVGPSMKKLFLDVFVLARAVALLTRKRYDFVHAHEESVFFCRFLKPVFGFRLVYDMHSSLPQQLTNFGYTRSRFLIGLFEKLEDSCLARADAVITICPELASYVAERVPDRWRHLLIENSLFADVRLKSDRGPSSRERDADWESQVPAGRPVIGYAGTFEPYQGIGVLIEAVAAVRRERPDAFLLMVGGTPEQVAAERERAERLGLGDDCLFTGRVPQSVAKSLMKRADVLTSPRVQGTNTPLKVYEQLASGKPLVATRILSHTQVLTDDVSFLAEPEPPALARAILAALRDDEARRRVVAAAHALYEREYAPAAYERKMRQLLEIVG